MARAKKSAAPRKTRSQRAIGRPKTAHATAGASDRRPAGRKDRATTGPRSSPDVASGGEDGRLRLELEVHRDELRAQNEDLRQTNAALLVAKERYAQLYEGAPVAYFTVDEVGAITEANLAGAQLLDATRNFLFGRRFDELVVPSSRASFRDYRRRVLAYGGRPVHETILAFGPRRFPVRIEGTRLAGPGFDHHAHCLLCVSDETERRRAEEERSQLEAAAAEAERVESLGTFAGGISHHFNNILAIALTHAELILEEPSNLEIASSAAEIRAAVIRAAELSRQMLLYTGRGPVTGKPLDLSEVIRSMHGILVSVSPKDSLLFELEDGLPAITGEQGRLEQIVLNLVINAAEAIAANGKIRVRTRSAPTARATAGVVAEDYVLFEVSDDGRGMDGAIRRRAFDPFFSTKFAGRGLGLASVRGNVRAHRGTVAIESSPDGGTTVRVLLPVSAPHPP